MVTMATASLSLLGAVAVTTNATRNNKTINNKITGIPQAASAAAVFSRLVTDHFARRATGMI